MNRQPNVMNRTANDQHDRSDGETTEKPRARCCRLPPMLPGAEPVPPRAERGAAASTVRACGCEKRVCVVGAQHISSIQTR